MEIEIHHLEKFESNHDELIMLAHDAAKETRKETEIWDIRKQSIATVIYSYTSVDSFFSFITAFDESACLSVVNKMSVDLQKRFEKFPLLEKIELLHLFKGDTLNRGKEPLQSFDLLRQLRNYVIHFSPYSEVVYTRDEEFEEKKKKLEKRLMGKFDINKNGETFPEKYFSKGCAVWAFNTATKMFSWIISEYKLDSKIYLTDISRKKLNPSRN